MFVKRLLFLTKNQLTAFPWAKGSVSGPPQRFTKDEAGLAAFSKYVASDLTIPIYLMVDLVEEEFRNETMPHVLGPDRKALIERRLSRAFPTTPYRHLDIQGREKKRGRRDDLTVLIGITEPDIVTPWLDIIRQHKASITGIFSLPLVSAPLLKTLDAVSPATLLVSWQSTSGLRFSFFNGRNLKISRMAPVPEPDPEKYAELFVRELDRTRSYLNSLRLMPRDVPLQVVLCTNPEMLDAVRPRCIESATIKFRLLTVNQVARKIGIKRRITTPFSDSLFIQLLGKRPPGNHFAPADVGRYYLSRLFRAVLYAASVLLFLGAVGGGGYYAGQGWMIHEEWQEKKRKADDLHVRYRQVIDQHLPTSIDPTDVKNSVTVIDGLERRKASPEAMMIVLSRGLEAFPELRLDSFRWVGPEGGVVKASASRQSARRGRGRRGRGSRLNDLLSGRGGGRAKAAREQVLESANITGKVLDIKGDIDYALSRVNGLMGALLKNPLIHEVKPLVVPKKEEKKEVLSGNALMIEKQVADTADFAFKITLKRPETPRAH